MAKVFLESIDTAFTISNNNTSVYGAAGDQVITIASGVTGVTYDQNTERVVFAGASSAYTYLQQGNQILVYSGGVLVATIPVQGDTNGTQLTFTDGTANAALTAGVMALGGTTVSSLAAAVVTPTTAGLDTTLFSPATTAPTTPTVGQTFSLTTGSDVSGTILGSASTAMTTGADTFTATGSTYDASDMLIGGEGNDILTITTTSAVGAAGIVTGIETINVNSSGLFAASYNADNVVAVGSTINVANSVSGGSFEITNLGTGATVGATGVSGELKLTTTAATSQTLTVGANTAASQTIKLTGTTGTDAATVAAAGTVALTTNNSQQIETVSVSGNGAAASYAITGTATTYTMTGSQNVTLSGDEAIFDGKTVTDSTTAGTTTLKITTADSSDLSKTGADLVQFAADTNGDTYTLANNQMASITTAVTGADVTFDINDQTTAYTNGAITVDLGVAFTTGKGIAITATSTTSDNISTLNLTNSTVAQTVLEVLATADTDVVISGSKAVGLEATSTAKSINASGLTAALTYAYDGSDVATVTGSDTANDIFSLATGVTAGTSTINGGASTADTLALAGTTNVTALTLNSVEKISLTDTGIATFKASQLSGKSYVVTGDGTDKIIVGGTHGEIDSTTIDLSSLVLDTTNVTNTEVTAAGASALAGTIAAGAAFTITGTDVIDTVDIHGLSGANTISTGAGADVITGGTGADTITGGEGADVITGGAGADTITLTETTAAVDVVIQTGGAATTDTLIGFTVGSSGDNIDLDFSDIEALATDLVLVADATSAATTDANVISTVTASFDAASLTASTAIVALNGTIASASALEDALETGGAFAMMANNAWAAGDIGLFLYTDGTDTYLAAVETAAAIADNAKANASDLTANVLIKFSGISSVTSFVDANFDIIA